MTCKNPQSIFHQAKSPSINGDYTDGPLTAAKIQMRGLLEKMSLEYAHFDEDIPVAESQFIHTLCLRDDWPTEDLAEAFANLAIHCICEGRPPSYCLGKVICLHPYI